MMKEKNYERNPLERMLSEEEVRDVIARAESLRISDEMKRERKFDSLPLSQVYDIARELDIPQEYVDKAVAVVYQNKEEMRAQLEEIGAKPSHLLSSMIKAKYYQRGLLRALKNTFPSEKFSTQNIGTFFYILRRKKNLIDRLLGNKERLVYVTLLPTSSRMIIYSPMFTAACREDIKKLESKFGSIDKEFEYDVYPDEETTD